MCFQPHILFKDVLFARLRYVNIKCVLDRAFYLFELG